MSAGPADAIAAYHAAKPTNDRNLLAPLFRAAVEAAIAECNDATNQLNAVVYETYRSNELQVVYYARGRTVRPPTYTSASRTSCRHWSSGRLSAAT